MKTARDVIADFIADYYYGEVTRETVLKDADAFLKAMMDFPEPVRLELAEKLNPWRRIETAPKEDMTCTCISDARDEAYIAVPRIQYEALMAAAMDSVLAWTVCASIHREFGKKRDALYTTRQADFVRNERTARAALRAAGIQDNTNE